MSLLGSGDRVTDTLVIDRLLGAGAFAEVHRVHHTYLGWQAMKLFTRVTSLVETHRLLDEARLLSTIGHPHVVRLFDANTVRTPAGLRGFFTMEYVSGGSPERLVAAYRPAVPTDLAVTVVEQVAAGLAVGHLRDPPIVPRDITLDNVLVGYDGTSLRVRVSDFGLARRTDPVTHLASGQGTYAFMAPEVLRGDGYSCASDVWSVGVLAYLLLTDRFPFDDGDLSRWPGSRTHRPRQAAGHRGTRVVHRPRSTLPGRRSDGGGRAPLAAVARPVPAHADPVAAGGDEVSRLARVRAELRQRRHRKEFRVPAPLWDEPRREYLAALLAEIRAATRETTAAPPAPAPVTPELDEKALANAATNLWRAQRKLAQRAEDGSTRDRQAGRYLRTCAEALADAGLVVQDHNGDPFHPGRSLEVLAFENDPALTGETVLQTVRPSVYLGERRIQMGQVIVGCPPDRAAGDATPEPETVRNDHHA